MNQYFKTVKETHNVTYFKTEQIKPVPITEEILKDVMNGEYNIKSFSMKDGKFWLDEVEVKMAVKLPKEAKEFWKKVTLI